MARRLSKLGMILIAVLIVLIIAAIAFFGFPFLDFSTPTVEGNF